jgi:hypothetical protein
LFKTDLSGLSIGTIYKGQAVQEGEALPLKMEHVCAFETSVLNQLTPRNNPEDGRIQFNFGGTLKTSNIYVYLYSMYCIYSLHQS